MTIAMAVTDIVVLAVIGLIMLALPWLMPRTVPLGVNVPSARADEPVVAAAIRRFRLLVVVSWVISVAALLVLMAVGPLAATLAGTLLFVAGTVVSYLVARQAIVRAKHDGRWYEGVTVRVVGDVVATGERTPVPVGWFAASLLLLAVTLLVGISVYDSLPDTVPIHWGADGVADGFAAKSVWSVFSPVIIGAIVAAGMFALSFVNRVVPVRSLPSADAAGNARRRTAMQSAISALLGRMMFVITATVCWISVVGWLLPGRPLAISIGSIALLVVLGLVLLDFLLRWRRAVGAAAPSGDAGGPDAPDEDVYWKGGMIYVNRDDPAILVPRRFGAGWTLNFGHPASVVIGIAVAALVIGTVVFSIASHGTG